MPGAEATEFEEIRALCLPEIVLAYVDVLNFGAKFISRDLLLTGMDLAAMVAEEGSMVCDCFIKAGMMAELVTAFAFTSQAIIRAEEVGSRKSKGRRKMDGRTLEIWSTKPQPDHMEILA